MQGFLFYVDCSVCTVLDYLGNHLWSKVWVNIVLCFKSKQSAMLFQNAPFCRSICQNFLGWPLPQPTTLVWPVSNPRSSSTPHLTPTFKYLLRSLVLCMCVLRGWPRFCECPACLAEYLHSSRRCRVFAWPPCQVPEAMGSEPQTHNHDDDDDDDDESCFRRYIMCSDFKTVWSTTTYLKMQTLAPSPTAASHI